MKRLRVIGVGSPFGDDQVGWRVVNELVSSTLRHQLPPDVSVFSCDRPGSKLITYLEGADAVVVIDAIKGFGKPGTVHRFDDDTVFEKDELASSHGLGVAMALELAKALGSRPATVVVYGIEVSAVTPDPEISEEVMAAIPVVAQRVAIELRELSERVSRPSILESISFH